MTEVWQAAPVDVSRPGGWLLVHGDEGFLVGENGPLLSRESLKVQGMPPACEKGLGLAQGEPVYLLELENTLASLPAHEWQSLRQLMQQADLSQFRLLSLASQVASWARNHRFCGRCGTPMQQHASERAMLCASCGLQQYPRLSPSMIVLVSRGDEILLARSPRFVPGVYSTLAGFVEPGETVEQCVAREVMEEVSLQVRNLRYIASQSWPFPHSLMLGFHAEYAGGEIVPQPGEIEDAQWFHVDALPPLPAQRSIARYLIELYLAQRSGGPEPVLPG